MKQSSPPPTDLDDAGCIFGAGVLVKHLQALGEEVEGVRTGSADIEFIHRARVASRRLRAAMPLFGSCLPPKKSKTWLKEIRTVTRALGEARDADVQIERLEKFIKKSTTLQNRPGLLRLMLRLHQQRQRLQAPVRKAMEHLIESRVVEEMQSRLGPMAERANEVYLYTPSLYQHSFQAIHGRLEDFLQYEQVVTDPQKVEELHEMRITAKWLRYTLETFAPLYANNLKMHLQAVKKVQEQLGDIHDCDVWIAFLPRFLEEERQRTLDYYGHSRPVKRFAAGIQAFEEDRCQARNEFYEEFLSDWAKWQEEDIWNSLRKAIQVPFKQNDAIDPPPG